MSFCRAIVGSLLLLAAGRPPIATAQDALPSSAVAADFFHVVATSGNATVWVAPPSWKLSPQVGAPGAVRTAVSLAAARNEYEPVQLVTRAGTTGHRRLSLGGPWTGPSGDVLETTLHDVLFTGGGLCATGVADRLAPVTFGANLDVCATGNQAWWLTVHVPTNAAAGLYENTLEIELPALVTSLPVRVTVYDFTLPADAGFTLMANHVFTGSPTNWDLVKAWYAQHRITLENALYPSAFSHPITWGSCTNFYDEGDQPAVYSVRALADRYLAGNGFNDGQGFPRFVGQKFYTSGDPRPPSFCGEPIAGDPRGAQYGTTAYNEKWGAFLKALQDYADPNVAPTNGGNPFGHDYLAKMLYLVMNEPQNAADHDLAAWLAQVSRQYAPLLRLMIAEEAKPEIFDNGTYPGQGYDVWLGHLPAYAGAIGHAQTRRAANGEESWWYMLPNEPDHFLHPTKIARPAVETRALAWLAWQQRVEGWYDSDQESPLLVVTNLPADVHITTTVRAELLRETAEDYAWFRLANGGAKPLPRVANPADAFVAPLADALTGWTRDPARLHALRLQLGARIAGASWNAQLPDDGVRPFGSYYLNFQNPAGNPVDDPLVVAGRTWEKVGWTNYNPATQLGWLLPSTGAGQFLYGYSAAATNADEVQKSWLYDDYGRLVTFVVGLDDGVYDVELAMGRPNANSVALATVNGEDLFGDRAANQPEPIAGNEVRTRRIAVMGGRLAIEIGQPLPGDLQFVNYLAIEAVAPTSRDGLDDRWQVEQFGSTTAADALADGDPDLDGVDNATEFLFGTDPNDGGSVPRLTTQAQAPALELAWPARSGRVYRVEGSTDLQTWQPLAAPVIGTATTVTVALPLTNEPALLLRIAPLVP